MNIKLDVYFHNDPDEKAQLDRIEATLARIVTGEAKIMSDLTGLTTAVNDSVTVEESAITLLNNLSQQITDLKNDPVALQALADSLTAEKDKLAAAIIANTPAA